MKIGFNLLLWTTHLTDDIYRHCAALKATGYDGVEVPCFDGDAAFFRAARARLDDMGLRTTALGLVPDAAHNPLSANAAHRQAGVDHLKRLVDRAAALGAEVLAGPFYQPLAEFSGSGPTEAEWAALVETQTEMAQHAQAAGVVLAVEPLNRFECYALNTAADAARLVRAVGVPGYGYLYDTFHANIEERDPLAALRSTLPQVSHIHLSENHRGTMGRGHIDFAAVLGALVQDGYRDWVVIEAFGHALPEIAAATRVWRPLFDSADQTYIEGMQVIRRGLAQAQG